MREVQWALFALAACLTFACSSNDEGTALDQATGGTTSSDGGSTGSDGGSGNTVGQNVSGAWCGRQVSAASDCSGDEVHYLELEQNGATVTGQYCEAFGKDCYPLTGSVEGTQLTFEYQFSAYTVTATLEIGQSLKGTFFSTKCGCEVPVEVFGIQ